MLLRCQITIREDWGAIEQYTLSTDLATTQLCTLKRFKEKRQLVFIAVITMIAYVDPIAFVSFNNIFLY